EKEIKKKEFLLKNNAKRKDLPPVRGTSQKKKDFRDWDDLDEDQDLIDVGFVDSKPEVDKIEKSLIEKEKGNAFFKMGKFKEAIVCYSKAISFDKENKIFYINRAQCYIKFACWVEAVMDCTTAIKLDPKNVKAFWRRGIAHMGLKDYVAAKNDLKFAATLEPTNVAIKQELKKIFDIENSIVVKNEEKVSTKKIETDSKVDSDIAHNAEKIISGRKRVAIKEVGDAKDYFKNTNGSSDEILKEISTKSTVNTASKEPIALKKLNEIVPDSKAINVDKFSGPKIESETNNLSQKSKNRANLSKIYSNECVNKFIINAPKNMYELELGLKSIKNDDEKIFGYLELIDPKDFPTIFNNSLQENFLKIIIRNLKLNYSNKGVNFQKCFNVLSHLSKVKRFDMCLMFLEKSVKKDIDEIFSWMLASCSNTSTDKLEGKEVDDLYKKYK
ncbi:hypothetical protein HK099_004262, partial [Clydaea vesicula]